MLDSGPITMHQRAFGRAAVTLRAGDGAGATARLSGLRQSGSCKAFLPRTHLAVPEVVFLNTSGGLTGGDRIDFSLELAAGAQATASTQTAERAYASSGDVARMQIDLDLGAGAALDWLPQETILFQASALHRCTRVRMAGDAQLVLAEMLVLGRAAMGETLHRTDFRDRREVWRDGRPALVDALRLDDACLSRPEAPRPALFGAGRAMGIVALVAPGAEAALAAVRAALADHPGVEAAASAWDGKCVVRLLAGDGLPLKRAVAGVLAVMRGGVALPRVWQI